MRFLKLGFSNTCGQLAIALVLLCVLQLSVFATSSATTPTPTSAQLKISQTDSSKSLKVPSNLDGLQTVQFNRSEDQSERSTNFTDSKMSPFSAINHRSNSNLADLTCAVSNSSANSITFTSRNLPTIQANRSGHSLPSDISKTRLEYLTTPETRSTASGLPQARNLKTSPTGSFGQLSKLPPRASGSGHLLDR